MKKNYITPKINVVQFEALCSGDIVTASGFKGGAEGECISDFEVVNEKDTKDKDLWGSNKWGDD